MTVFAELPTEFFFLAAVWIFMAAVGLCFLRGKFPASPWDTPARQTLKLILAPVLIAFGVLGLVVTVGTFVGGAFVRAGFKQDVREATARPFVVSVDGRPIDDPEAWIAKIMRTNGTAASHSSRLHPTLVEITSEAGTVAVQLWRDSDDHGEVWVYRKEPGRLGQYIGMIREPSLAARLDETNPLTD